MDSDTQQALFDLFMEAAGSQAQAASADSMRDIAQQVTGYSNYYASHTTAGGSRSGGSDALSITKTVFESGLGLVPLLTGLFGLFGGGSDAPPPLTKYAMPDRVYFEGADTGGGISSSDYDQMGNPRPYGISSPGPAAPAISPQAAPQVTVNVQAMDSRSFLDHSTEIAQAVRDAMLNSSPINDVVNNL